MASLNGNANTIIGSVGLFGGNSSSATGANAEAFEGTMPDVLTFAYSATQANPGIFTIVAPGNNLASNKGATPLTLPNGTAVTLGGVSSAFYPYTCNSASPGVFTAASFVAAGLNLGGVPVALFGAAPGGLTVSGVEFEGPYAGYPSAPTIYYAGNFSGNTFNLYDTAAHAVAGGATGQQNTSSAVTSGGWIQIIGSNAPTATSNGITYYVVGTSGATFNLALTPGGSGINTSGTVGEGMLQVANNNTDSQINYGGVNGYRTGATSSGVTLLSLDENPQLAWQNVPGATCQQTYTNGIAGSNNNTFPTGAAVNSYGWGASGGFVSGQPVYEIKAPAEMIEQIENQSVTPKSKDKE